jgi:NitT/TauT family transport system substrate-binding protein
MPEPIILLENLRAVFYAPFYMAVDRGYFADAGVDVQFVESPDPGDTLPRLMSGEVDVCWGGPLRVMRTHDQQPGCGLICFGEVVGRDPFFLVGKGFGADFSLADLKGKRLAVVSEVPTPWVCLRQDLIDAGVDVAEIDVIEGRTMGQNEAALAAGEIDAFMAFQPFAERGSCQDRAAVIYTAADRGPAAYTCFYTTGEAMGRRREDFRAMAAACKRAVQELYAEGAIAAVPTLVKYFPDEPAELLEAAVARYLRHKLYNPTGTLPEEGVGWLKRAMLTTGVIKGDVPFGECVDNSLVAD